jgi:hypothetical protein
MNRALFVFTLFGHALSCCAVAGIWFPQAWPMAAAVLFVASSVGSFAFAWLAGRLVP